MAAMPTPSTSTSSDSSQSASARRRRPRSPVCMWGDPSSYAVRTGTSSAKPKQLPIKTKTKQSTTPSPSEPSSPKLKAFSISSLKSRISRIGDYSDSRVPAMRRSKSGPVSGKQFDASSSYSSAHFPPELSRSPSTQASRSNSLSERPPIQSGEMTRSPSTPTRTTLRPISQASDISATSIEFSINSPSGPTLQKRTLVVAKEPEIVETPRRFLVSQNRTQGWRGEWNQDHMQDVISKLRQLK